MMRSSFFSLMLIDGCIAIRIDEGVVTIHN